jgi:sulfite exporter TauE/SafE
MVDALLLGFAIGLPGSLHCLGMCGPLALLVGTGKKNPFVSASIYHFSRAMSYSILGVLAGLVFQFVDIRPFQQQFSIIIGVVFFIAWTLNQLSIKFSSPSILPLNFFNKIPQLLGSGNVSSMIGGGLINGLLPCGLVYSALLASLSTGETIDSAVLMFGFGIATIPMMIIISLLSNSIKQKLTRIFALVSSWWLLIMAVLFLLRGASLGVPFLSPDFESTNPKENCCRPR